MSDEHPTLPLPDPRAQWVLATDAGAPAPKPRRRVWPWIVGFVVVVALAVGAWFAGEVIARGIVERTIRDQLISNLDLPADQQIDVDVPGAILPALIVGSLPEVTVSSDDVPLDGLTADVVVHGTDVPTRSGGSWGGGAATVTLDEAQVQSLLGTIEGFPAATVALAAPNVDVSTDISVLGLSVPVGLSLTPSASEGELVLTPESVQLAGGEISADDLVDRFGSIAKSVVKDWDVCIAQYLPAGLTLTGIRVDGQSIVADFDVDGAIMSDTSLQENGTCA